MTATAPIPTGRVETREFLCSGTDDDRPRWTGSERLEHIFEDQVDALRAIGQDDKPAIDGVDRLVTYAQLEAESNQLAHFLRSTGVEVGECIGLMFDRSYHAFVALLGTLKAGAAYVPLDPGFPSGRIEYIAGDAQVTRMLTVTGLADRVSSAVPTVHCLDTDADQISQFPTDRVPLSQDERERSDLSYIIYTSGTTGNPKGVAIGHPSIYNFVQVVGEYYGVRRDDRMYQGLTLAFDFSVEEIWVSFAVGATLVPAPPGAKLVGCDLAEFLRSRSVTALSCVPTLLASVEEELPALRYLLLSGEACPADLVDRWRRPGRRIVNAYGPTEATVTATWRVMEGTGPVTIGRPLPTYTAVIIDPDEPRLVPWGEIGEIGIGGIGLADGYLNRDDLTAKAFIEDFVGLPDNPSNRIYRSGDLGRIVDDEIEFLGRIDTQVKIRGYRIEVTEIESVIMSLDAVSQAVVDVWEPPGGRKELVAWYTAVDGNPPSNEELAAELRSRLPAYMIPSYVELLDEMPLTTSDKADRKALPPPRGPRFSAADPGDHVEADDETEAAIAACLADILEADSISVTADFFDDLGAYSLIMAAFCTSMRDVIGVDVAMRDVYTHPNVRALATHLRESGALTADGSGAGSDAGSTLRPRMRSPHIASRFAYYRTGLLQLLTYMGSAVLVFEGLRLLVVWVLAGATSIDVVGRTVAAGVIGFMTSVTVPIAMKWLVIGRFRPSRIPLWSMDYYGFWLVKLLMLNSPIRFVSSLPVINIYLRLLGAKIGRGALIRPVQLPICTDVITVGPDAVIGEQSWMNGYRVEDGYVLIGPVTVGARASVGQGSVLDIDTTIEDDGRLAHASALLPGARVPAGEYWHGSPARRAPEPALDRITADRTISTFRRFTYSTVILALRLLVLGPSSFALFLTVASLWYPPRLRALPEIIAGSIGLFLVGLALGALMVSVVSRGLSRFIEPGRVYPMFGIHFAVFSAIRALSNSRFFNLLFGDSALITVYLKSIGWTFRGLVQTGSNFGSMLYQDVPTLCAVGRGTMVSDGTVVHNATITANSFMVERVGIGANNFLGNDIHLVPGHRAGSDCLLATKVMVPTNGAVRTGVGLLGSPAFEIPRGTGDRGPDTFSNEELLRWVVRKSTYNLLSVGLFLLQSMVFVVLGVLGFYALISAWFEFGLPAVAVGVPTMAAVFIGFAAFCERWSWRFEDMEPIECSLYSRYFWRVERFWKFAALIPPTTLAGTPFRNVLSRLDGVTEGPMVFNDGARYTESTLVTVGARANLNAGSVIQGHSLEGGGYKAGHIRLGDDVTLGPNAFIHFGTTVGAGALVDTDAFLMKGESVPDDSVWQGNPAYLTVRPRALEQPSSPTSD